MLDRVRRSAVVVAAGLVPAAVLFGWFYVRNVALYGDIGASDFLLRLFRRRREGGVLEMMTRGEMWGGCTNACCRRARCAAVSPRVDDRHHHLGRRVRRRGGHRAHRRSRRRGPGRVVSRPAVGLCAIAVVVTAVTVAQHVSGGGNAYPRYLFPVLGVLAVAVTIGLDRIVARFLPVVLVGLMGWWAILSIPVDVNPRGAGARDDGGAPVLLQVLPVGGGWRLAAAVTLVVGCAVAATVLVVGVVRPDLGRRAERPAVPTPRKERLLADCEQWTAHNQPKVAGGGGDRRAPNG